MNFATDDHTITKARYDAKTCAAISGYRVWVEDGMRNARAQDRPVDNHEVMQAVNPSKHNSSARHSVRETGQNASLEWGNAMSAQSEHKPPRLAPPPHVHSPSSARIGCTHTPISHNTHYANRKWALWGRREQRIGMHQHSQHSPRSATISRAAPTPTTSPCSRRLRTTATHPHTFKKNFPKK